MSWHNKWDHFYSPTEGQKIYFDGKYLIINLRKHSWELRELTALRTYAILGRFTTKGEAQSYANSLYQMN